MIHKANKVLLVLLALSAQSSFAKEVGVVCTSDNEWRPYVSFSYDNKTLEGLKYHLMSTVPLNVEETKKQIVFSYYNDFVDDDCIVKIHLKTGRIKEFCGGKFQGRNNFSCKIDTIPELTNMICDEGNISIEINKNNTSKAQVKIFEQISDAKIIRDNAVAKVFYQRDQKHCLIRTNTMTNETGLFCHKDGGVSSKLEHAVTTLSCDANKE